MILGAVLAGGRSRRFGSDKAEALLDGERLVDHAATLLRPHVVDVVVVGREGGIPDLPTIGLGPLGGIAGALGWAQARGFAAVLTIACDMPQVPAEVLGALTRRTPSFCEDAPVLGCWPVSLANALLAQLGTAAQPQAAPAHGKDARLSVRRWAREIGALPIASPRPIANVNTPEDLLTL